jgi:hypothetical protein
MMSEAIVDFEIWNSVLGQRHIGRKLMLILVSLVLIFTIALTREAKNFGYFRNPLAWLGSFSNSLGEIAKPEILEAKVKPDKVKVNDKMTIVVKVKDSFGVKSVIADMAGIETVELKLKEGNNRQGVWEAIWKVHRVREEEYITKIIATNILGQEAFAEIKWSDPSDETVELLIGSEEYWGNDSANADDPYNTGYKDSRAQALYLASDLTAAGMTSGTIIAIQLKCYEVPGRQNLANFRIRMKLTPATTVTEWEDAWTDVYSPVNTVPTAGDWQTYVLTSPFYWDGASNLMIDISRDDTAFVSGGGMYRRNYVGSSRMFSGFCDSCQLYNVTNGTTIGSAPRSYVPSIKITYTPDNQAPTITSQVIGPPPEVNVGEDIAFTVHWSDVGVGSGATWTQATAKAQWPARYAHASVVYNNQMWVIGGWSTGVPRFNDVWSSSDGATWTQQTAAAQWAARDMPTSLVYNNKMWVIGGWSNTTNAVVNDVWSSSDGVTWTQQTAAANWPARYNHTSLVYNNKMWVLGGTTAQAQAGFNDVWSSSDGTNWSQVTAKASWRTRYNHTSLVYNNKMWVMGGWTGSATRLSDVWSSSDGATWTQATAKAQWTQKDGPTSLAYNNKMWVIGGFTGAVIGGSVRNDVWYSTDGTTWTQVTAKAQWLARFNHTSLVYNNTMWVIGGTAAQAQAGFNDVWYAAGGDQTKTHICKTNGISGQTCTTGNWCETTTWSSSSPSNCSYTTQLSDVGPQNYFAFVCDDDDACSITVPEITSGTFTVLPPNQSPTITLITTSPEPVSVGEKITFTVGWLDPNDQTKIHICKTGNFTTQTQTCNDELWCETDVFSATSPTSCSSTVQMGDSTIGNYYVFVCDDQNLCSDPEAKTFTISSPDQAPIISSATPTPNPVAAGKQVIFNVGWQDEKAGSGASWISATSSGQWAARDSHTSLVYNGQMWIAGGWNNTAGYFNDVWYSGDGTTWTQATAAAQWGRRSKHTSLVYNNKMWVIGGWDDTAAAYVNDVWYSLNGVSWTQATVHTQWRERYNHTSLIYNNQMWVIGGYYYDVTSYYFNDVWYSSDGTNWTQATTAAQWRRRYGHTSLVFNNPLNPSQQAMWVIGGDETLDLFNDVWYSSDGTNWTQATGAAQWGKRYNHTSLVYNNQMWVIGGWDGTTGGRFNDVWYSANGITWTQATGAAQWGKREDHTSLVYNNQMWVIGGYDGTAGAYVSDVWYSSGDQTKTHICKTSETPVPSPSELACPGGSWCDTTSWSANSPSSCSYTATSTDSGLRDYSAFVCDDDNVCSSPSSGNFTVTLPGQPQAIMSCDACGCQPCNTQTCQLSGGLCEGFCNGEWKTYQPTAHTTCIYRIINDSTDSNNDIKKTDWDLMQGESTINHNDCSGICDYTIPTTPPGDYTIKLRVTDIENNWDETTHNIRILQEVTADFSCSLDNITWKSCSEFSNRLYEGQLIYLKDKSTPSADAQIKSWKWEHNNGSVFSTGSSTFVSLSPSSNTIKLTVTDTAKRADYLEQTFNVKYLLPEWKEIAPISFSKLDKLMASISRFLGIK